MGATAHEVIERTGSETRHHGDWLEDHASVMAVVYTAVDILAVIGAGVFSHVVVFGTAPFPLPYKAALFVGTLLTWIVFKSSGLYTSWRGRGYVDQLRVATIAWVTVIALLALAAFSLGVGERYSRPWLGIWAASGWVLIIGIRLSVVAVLRIMRRHGYNHKRLVVVGAGRWGQQVVRRLVNAEWLGLDVVCFLDHDPGYHGKLINGIPVKGGYDVLASMVANNEVDDVWICLPLRSSRTPTTDYIREVMDILRHSTVTQRLVPDLEEMRILNQPVTEIMGLPVVNLNTSPMYGVNRMIKALEDRILATLIIVLISPIGLLIALAIKMDSRGPVFFKQMRHGWDGRPIKVYKFRTMRVHREGAGKVTQASRDDDRLTRVGRFLRRTSLDELPQFFNVLQGRMSIVGPRPHAIEHNEYYMDQIDSYMQRHKVKPGITGWAQVNGFRGETDSLEKMRGRVNMDLYYIEHWSLWFDLKIIVRTLFTGFVHENAY